MISLRIDASRFRFAAKPILIKTLTESHREFLNRSGGFVKAVAQRSMRQGTVSKRSRRRLRSKAPKPPRAWSGELKRLIGFRITSDNRRVYIEPKRFPGSRTPDVLEAGGRATIHDYDPTTGVVVRPVSLQPRPYMNPAREKLEPTLAKIWEDSFRIKRRGRGI